MSIAFLLFILWLSLTGLIGLVPYSIRALARLGLLAASMPLTLLTLLTQGWFPALMVLVAALTVVPSEWSRLVRLVRRAVRPTGLPIGATRETA